MIYRGPQDDSEADRYVAEQQEDIDRLRLTPWLPTFEESKEEFSYQADRMHSFPEIVMPAIVYASLAAHAKNDGVEVIRGEEHIRDRHDATRFVLFSADRIHEVTEAVSSALAKIGDGTEVLYPGVSSDEYIFFGHVLEGIKQGMAAVKANQQARGL